MKQNTKKVKITIFLAAVIFLFCLAQIEVLIHAQKEKKEAAKLEAIKEKKFQEKEKLIQLAKKYDLNITFIDDWDAIVSCEGYDKISDFMERYRKFWSENSSEYVLTSRENVCFQPENLLVFEGFSFSDFDFLTWQEAEQNLKDSYLTYYFHYEPWNMPDSVTKEELQRIERESPQVFIQNNGISYMPLGDFYRLLLEEKIPIVLSEKRNGFTVKTNDISLFFGRSLEDENKNSEKTEKIDNIWIVKEEAEKILTSHAKNSPISIEGVINQ